MLEYNLYKIGNKLLRYRKQRGMTQIEVAEKAGISDRTYADIERGTVNMRIETFIRICNTLQVQPNDLLMEDGSMDGKAEVEKGEIIRMLETCNEGHRKNAMTIMSAFLSSVNEIVG